MLFTAQRLQQVLVCFCGLHWEIVGGRGVPDGQIGLVLVVDEQIPHTEGYRLTIGNQNILIAGHDLAGVFYGAMTLVQLLQQFGSVVPQMTVIDHPDFTHRGIMLDISRDKVPTMDTLYSLIDKFASWKINQLQLYTEHTFAYRKHPEVWANASPITAEEVLLLDRYCRERFIDLVPNQNSFGHMHRWFEYDQYKALAEVEGGFVSASGEQFSHPFSLSPAHPETLCFVEGLFEELLPNFTSRYFNANCDETFDLGLGRSKELCEKKGREYVYLDFLMEIYQRVKQRGLTLQIWGDIVGHYPHLLQKLPNDVIALEWGYEADHPFDEKCAVFARAGVPFYVCPGTSAWTSISGRTDNVIGNVRSAAEQGLKHGALGILTTDWGDMGHWQTLPISYPGFVLSAALGWAYQANRDLDLARLLNTFVFEDKTGIVGQMAYELGNVYQRPGIPVFNGSILFQAYHLPLNLKTAKPGHQLRPEQQLLLTSSTVIDNLHATLDFLRGMESALDDTQMACVDAVPLKDEYQLAIDMLQHGAKRLLFMIEDSSVTLKALETEIQDIRERYVRQWLSRNRPGGLESSIQALQLSGVEKTA